MKNLGTFQRGSDKWMRDKSPAPVHTEGLSSWATMWWVVSWGWGARAR